MPLDAAGLKVMGDALVAAATVARLHSADPGTGNSNPTTAGDVTIATKSDDSSGNITISNAAFTGGAASGAVTWVTLWNTAKTVRYAKAQIPTDGSADLTFNAAGAYTITSLTINGTST